MVFLCTKLHNIVEVPLQFDHYVKQFAMQYLLNYFVYK